MPTDSYFAKFEGQKQEATNFNMGNSPNYPPDTGLLPILQKINTNPDVATFSSCSGHDGHPYIWVFFRTPEARHHFLSEIERAGFSHKQIGLLGEDGDYIEIKGTNTQRSIYEGDSGRMASPTEIDKFWSTITPILSAKSPEWSDSGQKTKYIQKLLKII